MRITTSSSEVMVLSQKRVACSHFLKLTSKKHIAVYFITQVPSQVTGFAEACRKYFLDYLTSFLPLRRGLTRPDPAFWVVGVQLSVLPLR